MSLFAVRQHADLETFAPMCELAQSLGSVLMYCLVPASPHHQQSIYSNHANYGVVFSRQAMFFLLQAKYFLKVLVGDIVMFL